MLLNNAAGDYKLDNNSTKTSKFFKYKTNIIGKTSLINNTLHIKVVVPLKYASNFWRSLDLSFLNCEIEFDLSWSKDFVTSQISKTDPVTANAPDSTKTALSTTRISLQITDTKIYVRGVTFLAHLKQGIKGSNIFE